MGLKSYRGGATENIAKYPSSKMILKRMQVKAR